MIRRIGTGGKNFEHRHLPDVERMRNVALEHGYIADLRDLAEIWEDHSDRYAAGWLSLPDDDDDLWMEICHWIEERCDE